MPATLMARRPRWAARSTQRHIDPAPAEPGLYRTVTGAEAISLGPRRRRAACRARRCSSAAIRSRLPRAILHHLSRLKEYGVTTFQAEDEIAAIGSAIGASFAGALGVTSSSGPGNRAQDRGDGPRDHDRASAGHRQLAARRALDRPSDQDRAVRPLPGGLWPQRRRADAGDRRPLAGRRVRLRDRGGAGSRSST